MCRGAVSHNIAQVLSLESVVGALCVTLPTQFGSHVCVVLAAGFKASLNNRFKAFHHAFHQPARLQH